MLIALVPIFTMGLLLPLTESLSRPLPLQLTIPPFSSSSSSLSAQETLLPPVSRRSFVASTANAAAAASLFLVLSPPKSASALQKKNEALCNTGFFENIWQYRCTDLGDISDEGRTTQLSESQEGSVESLMGKLQLDLGAINASDEAGEKEIAGSRKGGNKEENPQDNGRLK